MKCDEIQDIVALINQSSQNMITPPSTVTFTQHDEKKSTRRPGGQKGHIGYTLKMCDCPNEIITFQSDCDIMGNFAYPAKIGD